MAQTSTQSQTVEFRIALCLSSDGAHMCQTKSNDELNADVFLGSLRGEKISSPSVGNIWVLFRCEIWL